ncbi:hypothetical protein D9M68_532410 [compost metagenome]
MDDQVETQLHGVFQLRHRPGTAQAQGGGQAEDSGNREGDAEGQPGQLDQLRLVGEADRAGLGSENENADERQMQKILTAGGKLENRCAHAEFRNLREYSQGYPPPAAAKRHSLTYPA